MSGSVSSSLKESVKPFHIPTTPGGYAQLQINGTNGGQDVIYNHSSSATPMQNISNQLMQHQQLVSHFEVTGGSESTQKDAACHGDISQNAQNLGDTLMNLLGIMGRAYQLQSKFHCKEAEQIYKNELTNKQKETGWVQCQLAKCLYEQSKYHEAIKVYEKMRKIEPYRLEGLEYYSTCLWHLKD